MPIRLNQTAVCEILEFRGGEGRGKGGGSGSFDHKIRNTLKPLTRFKTVRVPFVLCFKMERSWTLTH